MTEANPGAEQALQSLHGFLADYWAGRRIAWMHDIFGSDFDQGAAHALTGLVLIPEVAAALADLDKELGSQLKVVPNLKHWHKRFER
ncbi:MAG: hypothetical protein LC721_04335 [Actinobacteria bacterium]|nr:hypothetical protein [Actinomycetota bacterium]